jgi:transposase
MRQKSRLLKEPAEKFVKEIHRATRRYFSAEDKIRIVLEGLCGEESIVELCRREGIFKSSTTVGRRTFTNDGRRIWLIRSAP